MSSKILVRDIPKEVQNWIERERNKRMMSQKDFVNWILARAAREDQGELFDEYAPNQKSKLPTVFTFADFFAGIGGFRLGLEKVGGKCIYSCEWDKYAQKTYRAWFGDTPAGDIRDVAKNLKAVPKPDVLAAGFPCQPFSIAGVSKKKSLGRAHGFKDRTQGTLFFYLATIIEAKRPPALILENVKNLLSHDKGQTWSVVRSTLEDLQYDVYHKVLDARCVVPQHRERVFIVGFDRKLLGAGYDFRFPSLSRTKRRIKDILVDSPDLKYTLSDDLWTYLQEYAKKHRERGNGFGFGLVSPSGTARTLSARYFKDGSEILIPQPHGKNPRRLTPRECARLMGFDDCLPIVVSDTQAYKQFGNSVVPALVEAVGREVVRTLSNAGALTLRAVAFEQAS